MSASKRRAIAAGAVGAAALSHLVVLSQWMNLWIRRMDSKLLKTTFADKWSDWPMVPMPYFRLFSSNCTLPLLYLLNMTDKCPLRWWKANFAINAITCALWSNCDLDKKMSPDVLTAQRNYEKNMSSMAPTDQFEDIKERLKLPDDSRDLLAKLNASVEFKLRIWMCSYGQSFLSSMNSFYWLRVSHGNDDTLVLNLPLRARWSVKEDCPAAHLYIVRIKEYKHLKLIQWAACKEFNPVDTHLICKRVIAALKASEGTTRFALRVCDSSSFVAISTALPQTGPVHVEFGNTMFEPAVPEADVSAG